MNEAGVSWQRQNIILGVRTLFDNGLHEYLSLTLSIDSIALEAHVLRPMCILLIGLKRQIEAFPRLARCSPDSRV